jgi:hypothetical protein
MPTEIAQQFEDYVAHQRWHFGQLTGGVATC